MEIETGEWKGTYYVWEPTEYGFAMATKSTESEEDARSKLEAGNGKRIFIGLVIGEYMEEIAKRVEAEQ